MSLRRWNVPLLLGGVTIAGLGSALLGGVPGAVLGDALLCLPLLAILIAIRRSVGKEKNDDRSPR